MILLSLGPGSEDSLEITAGSETKTVTLDLMLKRQEDAKRAAMTAANKNPQEEMKHNISSWEEIL